MNKINFDPQVVFHYTANRNDFESDEVFANFRQIKFTNGMMFRSASPCNNACKRAPYVDKLCKAFGIKSIIDLAETEEELKRFFEDESVENPYWRELYKTGKIFCVGINVPETNKQYHIGMAKAMKFVTEAEKPILIHCKEGKDRTGVAAMIIEAIGGATWEDLMEDFMKTYDNYFAVSKEKIPDAYDFAIESYYKPYVKELFGRDLDILKEEDIVTGIKTYLFNNGLTEKEIEKFVATVTDKD